MNPNSYQVVAHFYTGEVRGSLPNPHLLVMYLCFVDMLLVNSFHLFLID